MRLRTFATAFLSTTLAGYCALFAAPRDPTQDVNIFIGTGGHGHTYPGATVPFGMVQLSPDTYNEDWDWCSGYHYSDNSIMGFSHTHLSGTGVGDMLDVLLMPGTGPSHLIPGTRLSPNGGYRSRFSHAEEIAEPGYYSVVLQDFNIKAELSATERAGIHKYIFPQSDTAHFIVDLAHTILSEPGAEPNILSSELKILNNTTLVGGRRVGNWANGRHLYFALEFSKPFLEPRLVSGNKILDGAVREASGKSLKCLVHYKTSAGEVIFVKVGISGVSAEGALKNLNKEIPAWDFIKVRRAAHDAWQKELSKLTIETLNPKHRQIFYTSLYHTMLAPTLFDDVDGQYRGMDLQIHRIPQGLHNYSTFSLWDTYRALHPLFTLMHPQRVPDLVENLIRMAEESPEGMPVWPLQGRETGCMTGYHSVVVIAEASVKGFQGIDFARVYPLIKKRALVDDYRGLDYYRKLGYIPSDKEPESATKTLEYAYDDWAIALLARSIGRMDDYRLFLGRSANYRNLWDKTTRFIRPRLDDGTWAGPFDPKQTGTTKKWRDFTEANSWQATWLAQHDPQGYINLLGGREALIEKLDLLFNQSSEINGEVPVDMTGLVGMYAHGNEPSHHIPYLYSYAGAPYKTQERVRNLLERQYDNAPDGLAGNEDCGQMSAWYVMSALGFYAVDPASGNYVFGSPLFDRVIIDMGNGHQLLMKAKNNSPQNKYIQSIKFNGENYEKAWFTHAAITQGGSIEFEMGSEPNKRFGFDKNTVPPSMSDIFSANTAKR
jgi:predicted alpha-1,2-mannosidase